MCVVHIKYAVNVHILYFIYVYVTFCPLVLLSDTSKVCICVFILACSMMLN